MELDKYIKVYDNALGVHQISSIIKWSKNLNFYDGGVTEKSIVNKEIRNVSIYDLHELKNCSHTRVHWRNFLSALITKIIKEDYEKDLCKIPQTSGFTGVGELSLLKYEVGGHYDLHCDAFTEAPRILSCILLLNDDYKGGELQFADPITKEVYKTVENKSGKLIIWPSNFMFPHGIKPIIKGQRYSIVGWTY